MRNLLIIIFMLLGLAVNAQPSFFMPVPLITDSIDSVFLFSQHPQKTEKEGVFFYHTEDGMNMAFRQNDGKIWLSSLMPFDSPPSLIRRVQVDGKGSDDWVIFGNTVERIDKGLRGMTSVLVLSLDGVPMELFTADHYCWEWVDGNDFGEGEFTHGYGFDLLFNDGSLTVTALRRAPDEWCPLSPLHSGTFHWTDKGFRIPGTVVTHKSPHRKKQLKHHSKKKASYHANKKKRK